LKSGIDYFQKGYQPRIDTVRDENCDLVTEAYSILDMRRNIFSKLLNVRGLSGVMQTEILTADPIVLEPSAFEFEMATGLTKRHKSTVSDQFPPDLNKAGGRKIR